MKKIILKLLFVSLLCFAAIEAKSNEPFNSISKCLQEKSLKAYIFYQGTWHEGFIMFNQTENGYQLTKYQFNDIYINGSPLNGYFNYEKFTKLNPNNELALKNNFTHYVNIQGLNAYIISN